MFDRVRQDLVYASRRLRLSPGFTLGAVAVLALGVGVNLAEFHLFKAVMFPKIFVRDVDSLRRFSPRSQNGNPERLTYPAVAFYREHNTVLSAVLTETYSGPVTSDDDPGYLQTTFVSGNYFTELGSVPAYGRLLDEDDAKPGAAPAVVLGFSYWQRRFGSDPRAVGRTIRLNGKPVRIVGVAAHDFTGLILNPRAMWIPVTLQPYLIKGGKLFEDFSGGSTLMYGRVKPGVSNAAVEQHLTSLMAELQKQQPKHLKPGSRMQSDLLTVSPVSAREAASIAPVVLLILLILVSACANLGNMLLAKGLAREREIEIRIAVGASRWRVVRQLMTENLLLALIAAVAGLVVGQLTAHAMLRLMDAPDGLRITTDWRILIAGAFLTLFSTLVFGLTPAIQTARRGPRATRARQTLVAVQVAASCVLLIVGSFLTRQVLRTLTLELQFDYKRMMVVDPHFYSHADQAPVMRQKLEEFLSRISQIPGVASVTASTSTPLGGSQRIAGAPGGAQLALNHVIPSYFSAMQLPIVQGRTFLATDQDVVIVGESAARALWPNESAIGKVCESCDSSKSKRTVVGVAGDSQVSQLEVYLPLDDKNLNAANLIVRAVSDPAPLIPAARSVVAAPGYPSSAWLMQTRMNERSNGVRRAIAILGALGALATLLAAVGIFGLVSFAVSQRTRELGVRMALGARARDILRAVLLQYAAPVGVGVVAGIALAMAGSQIARSQMHGFTAPDPLSYAAGILLFAAIACVATMVPATRALRIDPSAALRSE